MKNKTIGNRDRFIDCRKLIFFFIWPFYIIYASIFLLLMNSFRFEGTKLILILIVIIVVLHRWWCWPSISVCVLCSVERVDDDFRRRNWKLNVERANASRNHINWKKRDFFLHGFQTANGNTSTKQYECYKTVGLDDGQDPRTSCSRIESAKERSTFIFFCVCVSVYDTTAHKSDGLRSSSPKFSNENYVFFSGIPFSLDVIQLEVILN